MTESEARLPHVETVAEFATRARQHTNECHQPELIRYAAARLGITRGEVMGAAISQLDAHGALLVCIDADGAHDTRITFDQPARCVTDLAYALRDELQVRHSR